MTWSHFWLCFLALSVPNIANVQARQALNHVNSICSTWGRHHFKTFDGDVYQFPGLCGYNLVSDCHEMYREFSVHIQKSLVDGHPTVNELVVTINDLVFHLTKRNVSLNGDLINLPYLNAGIQLERNAVYTKLQAKVGLVVMWNGDDAVMVELDSDYHNRTCGLCGDFNGVPVYNEFNHHNRKIHPIEFGNGQRVHRPNDECEDPYEEEEQELDAQDLEYPELEDQAVEIPCKEFRPICEKVIYSEAWSSCASLVDPAPYTQACVQDMCGCGNSTNDFCVCSTLAEFSRQCSHAGGQPPSWRTPQFCAKMCPFNMVYEESGSPCMASCTVSDISSLCEDHKMDGCFCPAGTVWDNISQRGCVSQTECQCKHDKIYNSGEVYRQDSKECLCYQGRWDCKSLPSPATCAVEEGSQVTTFDGKAYIFHGNCHYVLAKIESKDDTSPKFTIFVQLVPCVSQEFDTCLKSVKVLLNNDKNNMLAFSADGKVRHNMQIISLPYNTGDINIFQASSFHILLQTRFGLQIQVQHVPLLQVYVTLEQRYKTKTRGLCGNYNMMLSDDMKTPQGIVEGTASSFGNSWKSSSTCPERDERLESPCSVSVENERYAEHWCSMLTRPDGPFTNCHAMVDPELYHKRCIYATCNCEKTEDCMCAVFSSYARACASKGVFLSDWRVNVCDKYTRGCPESQSFSYKLQRCQWTCRQLSSEQQSCTSDFLPVDGCSCPEGTYQEEHGACVPMNKCPCYHNGVHIKPGKSISIKEQHCLCSNGKLHCRTWKTSSQACPTPKVYLNCSSTDVRDLGVQCARTCRNTEIDSCYLTECESGCQCPSGLLDDGKGSCVKEHECPCQHDHTLYASGSEIKDQCNTCTCRKGNWECTEKKCPGTCIIYGSGHYRTFDQRTYGFQGQCAYVAIQNKCGNKSVEDIFRVITENIPCGTTGTTCSKSVRIQLGNKEIKLAKGKYEVSDLAMGSEIKYTIRPVGMYLAVEASLGITVLWDRKTTIRILLEPQHSAGVCGLCGDFNGDVQNDFTTQSQMVVSSPLEFANSWKALSSCLDAEASADSCVLQPHRHNWAQIQCSIIRSVTFQDCHKKVNPIPFYENCVKDSCACDSGGDCECFCTAVAAYAQACNEVSVCVAWRTPEICPVFCDYYNEGELCEWHYKPCHEPCYETCRNPHGCNNSIPNLEGCYPVCPEDKPIFDEDKGICVESCDGCIHNGTYYNDNDVIYNVTDNLGMCYYAICKNGKVIETNDPCPTPKPSTTTTPFITSTTTPTSSPATTPRPTTPLVTTKETTTQEPTPTPVDTTSTNTPQTTMTSSSTTEPTTPEVTTRETTSPPVSTTTPPTPSVISTTTLTTTTTAPPSTTVATPTPVVTTTTTPTQETTSVTTTPSTTTEGTTGIPSTTPCEEECEWTQWFDVDSSTDGSDWETYENITNSGEKICQKPRNISCRSTKAPDKSFDDFVKETGQVVSCDINYGLICKKKDQVSRPYKCFNYQIKVVCCVPCIPPPTPPTTSTTVITSSPNPTPGGTTSEQPTPVFSTTISTTTAPPSTPVATPTPVVTTSPTTPQSTRSTTTEPTTTPTTTSTTTAPTSTPVVTPTPVVTTSTTTPKTTTTSSSTTEPTTTPTTTSTTTAPPSTPVVTPTPVVTTSTITPKTTTTSSSTTEPTTTPTTTSTTTAPPSTPVVTPTPVVTTSTTTPKTTTTSSSTTEPTTTPTTTSTTTAPPSTPVVTPTPVVTTSTTTPKTTAISSSTTEPTATVVTTTETTSAPVSTTTPPTPTVISTTTSTTTPTVPPSTTVATSTPVITSPTTPLTTRGTTTEPTTTPTVISTTTSTTTTAPPSTTIVTPTPVVKTSTTTPQTTMTSSYTTKPTAPVETSTETTSPPVSTTTPPTPTVISTTTSTTTPTVPPSTTVVTSTPVFTSPTTPQTTTTRSTLTEPTTTPTVISTTISTTTASSSTTVETLTPVTTVTKPHHSTTTPITTSSTTNESIVTGIVTTTTGPSTAPVGLPSASSTTETTYTVVLSTTTVKIPTTTTGCVCIVDGKHYKPGETIYDRKDIGSGICLSMICSAICELQNQTEPCHSTPSSTPSPPPPPPTCPEWDVTQNETFVLCDCIMAKCIENTTIEIVPYVCPPLEEIPCASGKKPVLIDDEYGCCKYYTCPCECEGWGDPHYITFDGVFYSYQGNCTYVLMEEITPKHNLKVIVDNVYCEPTEDVSCPRSIIVSYNSQVITLKNHNLMGAAKMEVLSSGETVKVPYYHQGIKVLSTGMSLILEIPTLQVVITFGITGFSISLPPREFVNNTMGHCGTCNNNKADDCMLPGGQLIQNCEVMADFYLVEDLYKPSCHVPSVKPTDSPLPPLPLTTCKPDSVCGVLLGSLFKACHAIVSPDKFYQGCIFDSCHVANPVVQCTSLQVYAASCAQAGVCLYWRNHTTLCPSNCPADKVYKPCGPAEQQTCEDKPGENQMNFTTEGCFCPDGMKLFNKESNICVDKCGCLDSEGVPREFNEIFDQNCQTCICEDSTKSVTCKPKDCPAIPAGSCTKPGFILVNQTHPADRCCLHYVCQCDSSTCPVGDLSCNVGYIPEVSVPMGHCCPVRHCLPKAVCVHKGMEYQVGSPVPVVKCQNCTCSRQVIEDSGLLEITCKMLACDQNCGLGYKYVSDKGLEECCGRCLQTHCVVDRNITQELLKEGETWSPPGNMCEFFTCVKIGETLTTIMSTTVCPHFQQSNCYPDTVQTAANGCCKICVEMDKGCKRGSMRQRITHNRCQAREDVDMPYCEGSCNTFARYEEMAAGLEHTCAGCWESRFSNRTVELECLNGDLVPYTYVHVEECSCGNTNCNRAARLPARKRRANIGV